VDLPTLGKPTIPIVRATARKPTAVEERGVRGGESVKRQGWLADCGHE